MRRSRATARRHFRLLAAAGLSVGFLLTVGAGEANRNRTVLQLLLYDERMTAALLIYACVALQAPGGTTAEPDLSSARTAAAALPRLHSLLVSHRGQLVLEYYAPGYRATLQANIKSASKSIISTLVGIAIERKLIPGLERADRPLVSGAAQGSRQAQAGDHDRRPADDAVRAGIDERRELRRVGEQPQLGALRAGPADGQRSRDLDGIQHGHVAPPLGDPHQGVGQEHAPVRHRGARRAARNHAGAAGRAIRRASISAATRC